MTPLHLVKRAPWYVANDAHAKDNSDASEACNGSLAPWWPWVGSKSFTATCQVGPGGWCEHSTHWSLRRLARESHLETDSVSNALGFEKTMLNCQPLSSLSLVGSLGRPLVSLSASLALKTSCYWFSFPRLLLLNLKSKYGTAAPPETMMPSSKSQICSMATGQQSSTFLLTDRKWQNWKQNWIAGITGNHWNRFSGQKIFGPSVQFIGPITQSQDSHFDSGLDQNWVTKTFFKATTSGVPFFLPCRQRPAVVEGAEMTLKIK